MKILQVLLLLMPVVASSQFKVTVIIDKIPAQPAPSRIYVAGNFNDWNPSDAESAFEKNQQGKFIKEFPDVQPGQYEFKFTLGSMESVECKADGTEIPNRILIVQSDTVVHLTIARWRSEKNFDESEKRNKHFLQLNIVQREAALPKPGLMCQTLLKRQTLP